jgi:two-component system, OmpR family, alkaline phosphatase synthesis response regulator PhoP
MKRIMLVEDEENLHLAIKLNLEMENYNVTSVYNGKNAAIKFRQGRFDLIILDVMLPEINGFDICESIRLENSKVPILFLTAKSSNEDKLIGLKMADDYLTKPFNLKELLIRVENLIKRTQYEEKPSEKNKLFIAGCDIDFKSFVVKNSHGDILTLTYKQIKLLKLLIEKKNQVISRQEILEKVWGYDVYPSSRTIDNFILLFRKVFEKNLPSSTYFKSIRGVGYKFIA